MFLKCEIWKYRLEAIHLLESRDAFTKANEQLLFSDVLTTVPLEQTSWKANILLWTT